MPSTKICNGLYKPAPNTQAIATNHQERLRILPSGKIGIGTMNPTEQLEVSGGIKVGYSTEDNPGTIRWNGSVMEFNDGAGWQPIDSGGAATSSPWSKTGNVVHFDGGLVGINTDSAAQAMFHLKDGSVVFEGATGPVPVTGGGARFMWAAANRAFRVGEVTGSQWDSPGPYSVGMGYNSQADAPYSLAIGTRASATDTHAFAIGFESSASGSQSTALGTNTNAVGINSIALGKDSVANGEEGIAMGSSAVAGSKGAIAIGVASEAQGETSLALGMRAKTSAARSFAFGYGADATGPYSLAIGVNVSADGEGRSFVIGTGESPSTKLSNPQSNSLAIGFNSDRATLFVGPASGPGKFGNVGIATDDPSHSLHVKTGRVRFENLPSGLANEVVTIDKDGVLQTRSFPTPGSDSPWQPGNDNEIFFNKGFVGVATNDPEFSLDVGEDARIQHRLILGNRFLSVSDGDLDPEDGNYQIPVDELKVSFIHIHNRIKTGNFKIDNGKFVGQLLFLAVTGGETNQSLLAAKNGNLVGSKVVARKNRVILTTLIWSQNQDTGNFYWAYNM